MRTAAAGLGLGAALYAAIAGRLPRPRRPGTTQGPPLAALIVSAAAEELFFRGAVLGVLRARRPRLAVPIAAAAFAASHLPRADGRAVAAFLLIGSVLGRVSTRPRGLAVAMVAHATYDVLALLEDPG